MNKSICIAISHLIRKLYVVLAMHKWFCLKKKFFYCELSLKISINSYIVISLYNLLWDFQMNEKTAEHVAEVLKAVAHPVRLQIVELLEAGEMCVGDIVEALGGKQAITSQQLNMMKDKGVLSCRRDGARVFYRIENKNVIKLLYCINDHCQQKKG